MLMGETSFSSLNMKLNHYVRTGRLQNPRKGLYCKPNYNREEEALVRISAIIFVERETQKAIIIGHQGKGLKKVGTTARQDMEDFIGKKVFLETFVKVRKNWRANTRDLNAFGYE